MLRTRKRTIVWSSILFSSALTIVSGCGGKKDDKAAGAKQAAPKIEGYVVQPQEAVNELTLSGTLLPAEQVTLIPEVSGRIVQLNLPEGTFVSKGTLLVKLFDADLQAQRQKLQAQLKTAEATEQRQAQLVKMNGISQQDYDLTVTQISMLKADVANLDAQISKTEIRAPFNGTIGLRNVSEGAFITPGTNLAVLRNDQQLKLDFSVPESYAAGISKAMQIHFRADGDTTLYSASVIGTEQGVDGGSLSLRVRALVTQTGAHLVPGTSVTVIAGLGANAHALMVPTQCIIPQARFKTVIVSRKGKAEFAKVVTGIRRPADVEIVSGLQPGDTIAVTGLQFVKPGAALRFSSVK